MDMIRWFICKYGQRLAGRHVEWSENWRSWPHCNGQASCWMHYPPERRWCRCTCRWCWIARKFRYRRETG